VLLYVFNILHVQKYLDQNKKNHQYQRHYTLKYLSQSIHIRLHVFLEIVVIIGITFDITEILLKVALNTITVTLTPKVYNCMLIKYLFFHMNSLIMLKCVSSI
jgi:hypothetical protein